MIRANFLQNIIAITNKPLIVDSHEIIKTSYDELVGFQRMSMDGVERHFTAFIILASHESGDKKR